MHKKKMDGQIKKLIQDRQAGRQTDRQKNGKKTAKQKED